MKRDKGKVGKVGNVGVVAVLVVVGVVTVGAIGLLIFDSKSDVSGAWLTEKAALEKNLMLMQAEKATLQAELKMIRERSSDADLSKLAAENKVLIEEKSALKNKLAELEEKLRGVESNTFFSDTLRERAELEVKVTALNERLIEKEQLVAELEQKNQSLVSKLKNGGESESILKRQLSEKDKVNALLSKYLADEKRRSQEIENQLTAVQSEKRNLSQQLDQLVSEKRYAQNKIAEMNSVIESSEKEKRMLTAKLKSVQKVINNRLGEIVRVKQALESTLTDTKALVQNEIEEIELEPIVVRANKPEPKPAAVQRIYEPEIKRTPVPNIATIEKIEPNEPVNLAREIVGKVLVVNENLNFIVIDKGANQGVEIGMKFSVVKDNSVIADTQVIEVRDNIAAADIQAIKSSSPINEGDYVRIAFGL